MALAVIVIFSLVFLCCCLRKSSRSATYDATRGRPVYVVRRWDERTEHVPNRGGSFRGSKGIYIPAARKGEGEEGGESYVKF